VSSTQRGPHRKDSSSIYFGIRKIGKAVMKKAVVGVLYSFDSTKVLMLKRKDKDRTATGWCFPGGKRDGVEDLKQALIREYKEETNLDISPTKLMLCADSGKHRIYVYEVVLKGSSPKVITLSKEHEDSAWAVPSEALDETLHSDPNWWYRESDCFPLAGPVTKRVLEMIARK
jgi:8-oxo-dGTP pyrophosphatase MutT (NUDIX family)